MYTPHSNTLRRVKAAPRPGKLSTLMPIDYGNQSPLAVVGIVVDVLWRHIRTIALRHFCASTSSLSARHRYHTACIAAMSSVATSSKVKLDAPTKRVHPPPDPRSVRPQCTQCGRLWPWVIFDSDPRHAAHFVSTLNAIRVSFVALIEESQLKEGACVQCQRP